MVGGLDESPEELRVKAVTALKAGTTNDYVGVFSINCTTTDTALQMKYEAEKITAADQIYANARNNISQFHDQAVKLSQGISSNVFGSTFGSSSNISPAMANPNPSAFGGTGAFGSAFEQPAFGQSGFGTRGTVFNQGTSAFGAAQPASMISQTSQPQSVFAQPQTASAFGQTSAFGQQSQPTSAFGQPSQTTAGISQTSNPTSAFGSSLQPSSAFGQSPQTTSLFGQSSLVKPTSSSFGLTTPNTTVFGSTSGGGFSVFASQPSGFSAAAAAASTGIPSAPASGSVFGQPVFAAPTQTAQAQSSFALAPQSTFGVSLTPASTPAVSSPMSAFLAPTPFAASLTSLGTQKSSGAPDFTLAKSRVRAKLEGDRFISLLPPNYSDILPADVKTAFTNDKFEWGKIPEWIPPKEVR